VQNRSVTRSKEAQSHNPVAGQRYFSRHVHDSPLRPPNDLAVERPAPTNGLENIRSLGRRAAPTAG